MNTKILERKVCILEFVAICEVIYKGIRIVFIYYIVAGVFSQE